MAARDEARLGRFHRGFCRGDTAKVLSRYGFRIMGDAAGNNFIAESTERAVMIEVAVNELSAADLDRLLPEVAAGVIPLQSVRAAARLGGNVAAVEAARAIIAIWLKYGVVR